MTEYKGLTDAEVAESRQKHGSNILTPPEKESLLKRFVESLTGPLGHHIPGWQDGDALVFILECAAVVSILISCSEYYGWFGLPISPDGAKVFFEPAGIIMAILLASGVGFIAEVKAEREFDVLNRVNDDEPVKVIRNGHATEIARKDVVVGDIILLSTGEEIPADAELLESTQISVDESTLTGEPMTRKSHIAPATVPNASSFGPESTYPINHVLKGTKMLEGHGIGRVFAVGDHSESGKVFISATIDDGKDTPLNEQFKVLGKIISWVSILIGIIVFIGRMLLLIHRFSNATIDFTFAEFVTQLLQSFMVAVTLVVCAVPEGLPMAVTMALAYSMRRMLKTNNLVRKLHACETMGATTVICTDKTGTLTQNRMQVTESFFCAEANTNAHQLAAGCTLLELNLAVNSTAMLDGDKVMGNPTEGALLLWLRAKGIDYKTLREASKVVSEEPFSTETKYMATTIEGGIRLIKGAPEVVMQMCGYNGGTDTSNANASSTSWTAITEHLKDWQNRAMRTLAFAVELPTTSDNNTNIQPTPIFQGIIGISDPIRDDVPQAIHECQQAGIRVVMVTGDNYNTAREIGRQIGLANLDEDIIARAKPLDKKNLVERLQKQGATVAVTGDGTNDAPAMNAADVGLSMGDGTSVAKEASDITIIDNSFASIVNAVMWGRSLYINIQRFIIFQLTVNVTACLVVMIGSFFSQEPPLSVTQLLWVNLIMDTFAAIALATLPPSRKVLENKPRDRKANIISRSMLNDIVGTGAYFTAILLVLLWLLNDNDMNTRVQSILGYNTTPLQDRAIFFTFFIMLQLWNLFLARGFKGSYRLTFDHAFLAIVTIIFVGQMAIINVANEFFNIARIDIRTTSIIVACSALIVLGKYFYIKLFTKHK